jgi:hypothetical protein
MIVQNVMGMRAITSNKEGRNEGRKERTHHRVHPSLPAAHHHLGPDTIASLVIRACFNKSKGAYGRKE